MGGEGQAAWHSHHCPRPEWTNPVLGIDWPPIAYCESCTGGEIAGGTFQLIVRDFSHIGRQELEAALSPEAIARIYASPPYRITGPTYRAKADAVPVSLGDLTGLARRIGIKAPSGWSGEVIAMWVGKDCVSVFALLTAKSAAEIATDGLDMFVRAIGVEWYKPAPDPSSLAPPPIRGEEFPLGDAFRRRYLEKP